MFLYHAVRKYTRSSSGLILKFFLVFVAYFCSLIFYNIFHGRFIHFSFLSSCFNSKVNVFRFFPKRVVSSICTTCVFAYKYSCTVLVNRPTTMIFSIFATFAYWFINNFFCHFCKICLNL